MALPYDIYKVKLIKKRLDKGDSVPYYEYEVTSPHNGYNIGDRLMLDNDLKTIILIKRHLSPLKSPIQKYTRNTLSLSTHVTSLRTSLKPAVLLKSTPTKTLKVSNTTSTKSKLKTRNRIRSKSNFVSSKTPSNKIIPKNDLSFISQYILAYLNGNLKRLNAFNVALAKNPNKNLIWKGIWPALDPSHTPEKSALDHKYLWTLHPGTRDEIGMTNWYNAFNGNTMAAEGSRTDGRYFDIISPEYRQWSVSTVNPNAVAVSSQDLTKLINLENMISQNPDMFKALYDYARQHNGAFDYTPSAFDSLKLNSVYRYGGIGDFMDTYGLSPQELYNKLELYYSNK